MNNVEASGGSLTNNKAIASLIIGILSIAFVILGFVGLILGVIGLVIGIIGLNEIKHLKQEGKKVAVTGIVLNCLGILLPVLLAIIAYITFIGNVS